MSATSSPSPSVDKDLLISQIMSSQENVKELLQRLNKVRSAYDTLQSENEMLVKYIQNLRSTTADLKST
ncbi:hypothetical protein RI367_000920 [Sorochytrium milnesiophthora]